VETYTCCDTPPPEQQLRELLSVVDIFSPNSAEAASIVGPGTPQQLVQRLLQLGAQLVALRMGGDGVLLARVQQDGQVEACAVRAGADAMAWWTHTCLRGCG
jgi:sugar/nucleoside kinase (ribokinase family)